VLSNLAQSIEGELDADNAAEEDEAAGGEQNPVQRRQHNLATHRTPPHEPATPLRRPILFQKLGVTNRSEAITAALQRKLVKL
jgi:hypothetical protein